MSRVSGYIISLVIEEDCEVQFTYLCFFTLAHIEVINDAILPRKLSLADDIAGIYLYYDV